MKQKTSEKIKTIRVDIDGTICTNTDGDYESAIPFPEVIKKINNKYTDGYKIIYWTARGATTGINWSKLTNKQLKKWGVKYHSLEFKPHYDLFICDKVLNANQLDSLDKVLDGIK